MPSDWNYNMSISEVLDILENTSFSKQQYKDLILGYHIQRLNENNYRYQATQTQNQNQQQSATTISQKIAREITTYEQILSNQFYITQAMFGQIQDQNIPNLNDCVKTITSQLENLAEQKSVNQSFSLFYKSEKFEKYDSTLSGISDIQSELSKLKISFEQYKQQFQQLTEKLKTHKEEFEKEKKINKVQGDMFMKNILEISNKQQ